MSNRTWSRRLDGYWADITFGPELDKIWPVALQRTREFFDVAVSLMRVGQDWMDTLRVSCYLQGMRDATDLLRGRVEGDYEEER